MSEITKALICECGHGIRFHHDGKGIYAKGCNQPLAMEMECPCTLDWGMSQPTDQIRELTADRDKYQRQVAEYDELLCVTCGFNIEIVDFEGEGKRAICRKCEADRDKYRDACERLIEHYGAGPLWDSTGTHGNRADFYIGVSDSHGYDFARQVRAEIESTQ